MTLEEAKQWIVAGCQIVYNGITYLRAVALEFRYDRNKHDFVLFLILLDRNQNSVIRVPAEKCVPIPL